MREHENDLAREFLSTRRPTELLGKEIEIEGQVFDLALDEDPQGSLKEALIRNAAGGDPAPSLSDEELYRRFREAHDA